MKQNHGPDMPGVSLGLKARFCLRVHPSALCPKSRWERYHGFELEPIMCQMPWRCILLAVDVHNWASDKNQLPNFGRVDVEGAKGREGSEDRRRLLSWETPWQAYVCISAHCDNIFRDSDRFLRVLLLPSRSLPLEPIKKSLPNTPEDSGTS